MIFVFYVVIASFYLLKLEFKMQIRVITRVFTRVITRLASSRFAASGVGEASHFYTDSCKTQPWLQSLLTQLVPSGESVPRLAGV